MERISSGATFYQKRIFPVGMFGFLLLSVAIPVVKAARAGQHPPLPAVIVPIIVAVCLYFVMKWLIFNLVDEVWDAGDALIVRNRGQEDKIALAEIMNIGFPWFINPPRVTLTLRTPSVFGDRIRFLAPMSVVPFATSPIVGELIKRIDAARHARR